MEKHKRVLPHFQIIMIMYTLRSACRGTTYETMPCHFRSSTAELAELMCRSHLIRVSNLNISNVVPQSNLMAELSSSRQWMLETGLGSVSVRIGDLTVSSQALAHQLVTPK